MTANVYLELTLNPSLFGNGHQGTPPSDSVLIQVNADQVNKNAKSPIARVLQEAKEDGAIITRTGDRTITISVPDNSFGLVLAGNLQRTDRARAVKFSPTLVA